MDSDERTDSAHEEGVDIREAMRAMDPADYIPMLDSVRSTHQAMHNFITNIAMRDPILFRRLVLKFKTPDTEWLVRQKIIEGGTKIEAIKYHRELTGMGLHESKQIVDRWQEEIAEGRRSADRVNECDIGAWFGEKTFDNTP